MVFVKKQPLTPTRLLRPLLWMLVMFYMGYHTLNGERGIYALMRNQRDREILREELATTRAARERMELKVSHLRDGSIDRDLLDEQVRRMMGVMKKGEVMVLEK